MLFHLGGLWRLNELGLLAELRRVSAVSGGAIAASALAVAWDRLAFDDDGVARGFAPHVVGPLRALAGRTIDRDAVLFGVVLPGGTNNRLAASYRRFLLGRRKLADTPANPDFVFTATDLQTGALWSFSRAALTGFRVGRIENPDFELATAVAASSAFPPFLSPALLRFAHALYAPGSGLDLQKPPYTTRPALTDGGVYDNLGLEPAFKLYRTILVSDAGAHISDSPKAARNWGMAMLRVTHVIDNQVRELRKQRLIESYEAGEREGAFWAIRSDVDNFPLETALPAPRERTERLASISTRLAALPAGDQQRLINWGYAVADAALRAHLLPDAPVPERFPYPAVGV
jgi:NTE family protein